MRLVSTLIVVTICLLVAVVVFTISGCTSTPTVSFHLTLSSTGYGNIEKNPDKSSFSSGEKVTLTAVAGDNWEFDHWEGALSGNTNPTQLTMNSNKSVEAVFEETEEYSITINIIGQGNVTRNPNKNEYSSGEIVELNALPSTGWVFDHWEGDLSGNTSSEQVTMNSNKTITAVFIEEPQDEFTLNISKIGNGNITKNPNKAAYSLGEEVELTAAPEENWHFSNWIDGGTIIQGNNPLQISMIEDKNITGVFKINTYTLDTEIQGQGTVSKTPDKEEYEHGETINLNATPAAGWSFVNWLKDGNFYSNNSNINYQIDEDVLFTAVFDTDNYILTLEKQGSGEVAKTPDKTDYLFGETVTISATPDTGWEFLHWLENEEIYSDNRTEEIQMNDSRTFTAVFLGDEYTINLEHEGQGEVAKSPEKQTYNYGDELTLSATPAEGWRFDRWLKNGGYLCSQSQVVVEVNDNATYRAVFEEIQYYTLTTNVNGNGSIQVNPDEDTYEEQTVVTLTANPANGWRFDHWEGDQTGSTNPKQITMNSNKNITAVFVEIQYYTLTVNINGSGSVTKNPNTNPYEENTVVTLTANPANGWRFDHWEGDVTGSTNPKQITMDYDKNITAVFVQIQYYTLTVTTQGNGSVSKNPNSSPYEENTVVTLTANPDSGWRFDHWEGNLTGSTNPVQITMNSNKSVKAVFVEIQYFTLTTNVNGNGSVSKNPNSSEYMEGTTVTLTANPDAGWQFKNWSGNLTGTTNPKNIVMNSNKNVTANFEKIPSRLLLSDGTFGTNSVVSVYITAEYFEEVNSFDIVLEYDEAYFSYLSSTLLNEFVGVIKLENQTSGGIIDLSIARTGEVEIQSSQILEIKLLSTSQTGNTQISFTNETKAVGAGEILDVQITDTGNYTIQ